MQHVGWGWGADTREKIMKLNMNLRRKLQLQLKETLKRKCPKEQDKRKGKSSI